MDCETCRFSPIPGMVISATGAVMLCPNLCIGRIASCCDAAGSQQPELRRETLAKADGATSSSVIPSTWRPGFVPCPAVIFLDGDER